MNKSKEKTKWYPYLIISTTLLTAEGSTKNYSIINSKDKRKKPNLNIRCDKYKF